MLNNPADRLKLFQSRIHCAVNQIKVRGLQCSSTSYSLARFGAPHNRVWQKQQRTNKFHPFSIFLEGRKASEIGIARSVLKDIERILRIPRNELLAFNYGLKGSREHYTYALGVLLRQNPECRPYFDFGLTIRHELNKDK